MRIVAVCGWLLALTAFAAVADVPQEIPYTVIARHPHDVSAFTEGLLIHDGLRVESTGNYGKSGLFVRGADGKLQRSTLLPPGEFGEGVALAGQRLYQLTWREGVCHVYGLDLRHQRDFSFVGEGWGLTFDGHDLIRSDGTSTLHFHDPADFRERRAITVHLGNEPLSLLNELEYVDGRIYANVWLSDRIVVIDPKDGDVTGWLDLTALKQQVEVGDARDDVLNGIAFDTRTKHLWVTGKHWPWLFELDLDNRHVQ